MNLDQDWNEIVDVFNAGIKSSKHVAIATVDASGHPSITPIGFAFLNDDRSVHYFEQYSETLPKNFESNRHVCLLAVNSSTLFWVKSLLQGRFPSYPGIRLYGVAGDLRPATYQEKARLQKRIGFAKKLKGSKLIWSELDNVRDIQLNAVRPIQYPKMMKHLFTKSADLS